MASIVRSCYVAVLPLLFAATTILSADEVAITPTPTAVEALWEGHAGSDSDSAILITVSHRIITPLFERDVIRKTEVADQILNMFVTGESETRGHVRLELVPSQDRAVFDVLFTGTSVAHANATNEWAVVPNITRTALTARTRIVYDGKTLKALPSRGSADSQTKILNVQARPQGRLRRLAPSGFIERAGRRQISRTLAERERIGARNAVRRLQQYLDREIAKELANAEFPRRLVESLEKAGLSSRNVRTSSSADALHVAIRLSNVDFRSAVGAFPKLADNDDIAVRLHQSAVDQLGQRLLAGAILNQAGLSRDGNQLFEGSNLPARCSVTLHPQQPICVQFSDGLLDLTVKSRRFELAATTLPGLCLHMRCRLQPTDGGLRTELVGSPRVTSEGTLQWAAPIKLVIEHFLTQQLANRILKTGFQIEKLGEPALRTTSLTSDKGWLTLAWSRSATVLAGDELIAKGAP